jgi:hypothetical protein
MAGLMLILIVDKILLFLFSALFPAIDIFSASFFLVLFRGLLDLLLLPLFLLLLLLGFILLPFLSLHHFILGQPVIMLLLCKSLEIKFVSAENTPLFIGD